MATYSLTVDEYKKANLIPIAPRWERIVAWSIAALVLAGSLLIAQYAFSAMWLALLVFIYITFYRMTPRIEANRLKNNPFALGPFDLDLGEDSYTVRVGETVLQLSLEEFGLAHDLEEFYRLDHKSGVVLLMPKRVLSDPEVTIIESYRERFSGRPEKTDIPAY